MYVALVPFGLSSWWEFWTLCEDDDDESDDGLKGENSGLQRQRTDMWNDEVHDVMKHKVTHCRRDEARQGEATMWDEMSKHGIGMMEDETT